MLGVQLVLACLFAFLGYRESSKFERDFGRHPYGIPPWGWAAITGLSLLLGALLLHFARRSAKNNPAPQAYRQLPSPSAAFGSPAPQAPQLGNVWAAPPPAMPQAQLPMQQTAPWPPTTTASRDILPGS
jgi:hypothetical protein